MGFVSKEIRNKLRHIFGEDISKISEKDTFYFWVGTIKVRVSNHKTHVKTWVDDMMFNPKKRPTKRISIVFEDKPTVGSIEVDGTFNEKLSVYEWTYELWNDKVGININGKGIEAIAKAIFNTATKGTYIDAYNKVFPVEVKYEPQIANRTNYPHNNQPTHHP